MDAKTNPQNLEKDPGVAGKRFVLDRLAGFSKDLHICLMPIPSMTCSGNTHAYFPALIMCCGFIEYLTALHRGNPNKIGWQQVANWTNAHLPQPEYDEYVTRILFDAFRNSVAHRGIASGIWIDQKKGPTKGDRLTWRVTASARRPAIEIITKSGTLKTNTPWPCRYTHIVRVHLKALRKDIRTAATAYAIKLEGNAALQAEFVKCMNHLFPR